ncbi:MAG: hypothetical protein ACRDQD_32070 [Nocardioidaceae bacterium]
MTSNRDRGRDDLGGFEKRLLGELKTVVAQRAAELSARRPARTPLWRRPRIVSVASAGALAIGAAVGIPLLGGETAAPPASAAFDLRTNEDGTITVTIYEFDDAEELEAQLEAHGVPADVAYTPEGKRCQPGRYTYAPEQHPVRVRWKTNDISFTVRPSDFADDETLIVTNDHLGMVYGDLHDTFAIITTATALGPVEECVLDDDPNDPLQPTHHKDTLEYEMQVN